MTTGFSMGVKSILNGKGVNRTLWSVAVLALTKYSKVDFGVATSLNGERTTADQAALYAKGRTAPGPKVTDKDGVHNLSNHQDEADGVKDGFDSSVDLTAWVGGQWDFNSWSHYYEIAWAMCQAAKELGIKIRWGGNWNEDLMKCNSLADVIAMAKRYTGKLPDGPHFELAK